MINIQRNLQFTNNILDKYNTLVLKLHFSNNLVELYSILSIYCLQIDYFKSIHLSINLLIQTKHKYNLLYLKRFVIKININIL